jgi:hypothetical protein
MILVSSSFFALALALDSVSMGFFESSFYVEVSRFFMLPTLDR